MTGPVLAAQDVTFGYRSGDPVIEHLTAQVDGGEVVALTGPSGRGKSTLLYVLGLMLRPGSGTVRVDGLAASDLGDRARSRLRAHRFGFVFQDAALDASRTVLDNVVESALYRHEDPATARQRAEELLDALGVGLRATHRPGQVSGGQAQRIAVCRALLSDPHVLLCDEPTGNLDSGSTAAVLDAVRAQAARGSAVVVATHDPVVLDRCDRAIRL